MEILLVKGRGMLSSWNMPLLSLVKALMKRFILFTFSLLLFSSGCNSEFIDNIFTFNVEKSFEFTIPANTPAGITAPEVNLPLVINDSILQANGTSMSLLKSAKLTKLRLAFTPPSFTLANIDTLNMRMKSASYPNLSLAYYRTGLDTVTVTNVDFAPALKEGASVGAIFRLNTSPAQDIITTATYTLTITANPF